MNQRYKLITSCIFQVVRLYLLVYHILYRLCIGVPTPTPGAIEEVFEEEGDIWDIQGDNCGGTPRSVYGEIMQ